MPMNLTPYGKAARQWRAERGIRQIDLASEFGVTAAYMSNVEKGRYPVPEPWLNRLPEHLRREVLMGEIQRHESEIARLQALLGDGETRRKGG